MRQPNLSDVALFPAVVEAGGFRAAAQKRGMSARLQSGVGAGRLAASTVSVPASATPAISALASFIRGQALLPGPVAFLCAMIVSSSS